MAIFPSSLIAFAIIISLLPGVAFIAGVYAHPKVSRDALPVSTPFVFAVIFLVALGVQLVLLLVFVAPGCGGQSEGVCAITLQGQAVAPLTVSPTEVIGFYLALFAASVLAFLTGFGVSAIGTRYPSAFPFVNTWSKQYTFAEVPPIAFVMTTLPGLDEPFVYRGFLSALHLDSKGAIVSVHLASPNRFYLRKYRRSDRLEMIRVPGGSSLYAGDFVIEGGQIANLVVRETVDLGAFRRGRPRYRLVLLELAVLVLMLASVGAMASLAWWAG
ncbi:MAG: hypothetical protein RIB53_18890 [Roseitalea porphyridii]|jgi:hypothetical protein|uniref:hypothetical protein n=1 Tax=Roseitalea porphyridii TaxID=1852022 RepID=UPI0032EC9481